MYVYKANYIQTHIRDDTESTKIVVRIQNSEFFYVQRSISPNAHPNNKIAIYNFMAMLNVCMYTESVSTTTPAALYSQEGSATAWNCFSTL
jgi:hypothetical protein